MLEESILEGDFFGDFSRFFDLPYLSSSFISTSSLSSFIIAKPKVPEDYSSFFGDFLLSDFIDLDFFNSFFLDLDFLGFFSFLADFDFALDADFLAFNFGRLVSFFAFFALFYDFAGDLEADRTSDLAGDVFFESRSSLSATMISSSAGFRIDDLPEGFLGEDFTGDGFLVDFLGDGDFLDFGDAFDFDDFAGEVFLDDFLTEAFLADFAGDFLGDTL